jgi:putative transposase
MSGVSGKFLRATPGQVVAFGSKRYRITHLLTTDSVLAEDLDTRQSERLRVENLAEVSDEADIPNLARLNRDTALFTEEEWAEGQRRFEAIKPLLDDPIRSRASVEAIAKQVGTHASTLYKWLKLYQAAQHVSVLIPLRRGSKLGTSKLAPEQEAIIESAIEDVYLHKLRKRPQSVVLEVQRRCYLAKVKPPNPNSVRLRIKRLTPSRALRSRGQNEIARNRFEPILGEFPGASAPLSVVQIDHTPADIIIVDPVNRLPIGRPFITAAIDVYSRMIVGIYLSFDPPSAASVALCLSNAMCPKREYLATLGVSGDWPVWGVFGKVYVDNGKDFRSVALSRGCEAYGIDLEFRPAKTPHYGGHIERLLGTLNGQSHQLPGTTFSNPRQRKGYDSAAEAVMTLTEYEQHLVDWIVNVYHQRKHDELVLAPQKKWELGIMGDGERPGTGLMPIPSDPLRLQLDFMPFVMRSVQRYGIQIDNVTYFDHSLTPYINSLDPDDSKRRRMFLVRRDPRDISKVYFLDPADGRYLTLPYANIGYPPMSLFELREIQAKLRVEGASINEHQIFEALTRQRARVESAQRDSKAARRKVARMPNRGLSRAEPKGQHAALTGSQQPEPDSPPRGSSGMDATDPFEMDIQPFDDIMALR